MGRYLLCTKEADSPYEVEELDLRIYSIEELAYLIYYDLDVLPDDFIDERLLTFIEKELKMPEVSGKIRRFYTSPQDFDATVIMLFSEVSFFTEQEINEFRDRIVRRRRKSAAERLVMRSDALAKRKRYNSAIRLYRSLLSGPRDGRMNEQFYTNIMMKCAACFGRLCEFDNALEMLFQVYKETGSPEVLKKLYDICILSGQEPDDTVFRRADPNLLAKWQSDYWEREAKARMQVDEHPAMQLFLKSPDHIKESLEAYTEETKDAFRGMLE